MKSLSRLLAGEAFLLKKMNLSAIVHQVFIG